MALKTPEKEEIVNKFRVHESDTGSPEVQVALLTNSINNLTDHFRKHPKDFNTKRSLLKMVGRRKKLLKYLKEKDESRYKDLIAELGLRK